MRRTTLADPGRPLGFLAILLVMVGILFIESYAGQQAANRSGEDGEGINVDPDTVYVASASIMGLAVFGSILGVRAGKQPYNTGRMVWLFVLIVFTMLTVAVQVVTMHQACCAELDPLEFTKNLVATLVCLIGILVGFLFLEGTRQRGGTD